MLYNFQYKIYLPIFVALNIFLSTNIITDTINIEEMKDYKNGVVKYYNEEKGFGYIIDGESKDELFVYEEGIIDEISDNDDVRYHIRNTRKGYEAFDVRLR